MRSDWFKLTATTAKRLLSKATTAKVMNCSSLIQRWRRRAGRPWLAGTNRLRFKSSTTTSAIKSTTMSTSWSGIYCTFPINPLYINSTLNGHIGQKFGIMTFFRLMDTIGLKQI